MPQVIRVLQCFSCQMYQVDIVKKAPKWTCKLCSEKQSVKMVFFQGSGKECRLQVQRLNELRGSAEQNRFNEDVSPSFDCNSSEELPPEEIPPEETQTQPNWSDFLDDSDDGAFDEIIAGSSIEYIDQGAHNYSQENDKPKIHQQTFTEISKGNGDSSLTRDNIVHEAKRKHEESTEYLGENQSVPAAKLRKIESNNSAGHQSEWDQYLPDELSDEW